MEESKGEGMKQDALKLMFNALIKNQRNKIIFQSCRPNRQVLYDEIWWEVRVKLMANKYKMIQNSERTTMAALWHMNIGILGERQA